MAPTIPDSSSFSLGDTDGSPRVSQATLNAYEKKLEKWYADDSNVKVMIYQTVVLEIRTQISELSTTIDT